jgi:hypothetical protein
MPTDRERVELLRLVSASRNAQLAGITTLRDAALLAVEQVQDARIRMLEQPSAIRASQDALFDLMIGYVVTPIVARPVSQLVKGILDALLRTRLAFRILPKSALGAAVTARISYSLVDRKNLTTRFLEGAQPDSIRRLYRDDHYSLLSDMYGKTVDAAGAVREIFGGDGELSADDSGGVRVLAAVLHTANTQQQAVCYLHDLFELWTREEVLTKEQGSNLAEVLRIGLASQPSTHDLLVYRDHLRIHLEGLIWTLLLWDELDSSANPIAVTSQNTRLRGTTVEQSRYMAARLISASGETFLERAIRSGGGAAWPTLQP